MYVSFMYKRGFCKFNNESVKHSRSCSVRTQNKAIPVKRLEITKMDLTFVRKDFYLDFVCKFEYCMVQFSYILNSELKFALNMHLICITKKLKALNMVLY